MCSQVKCETCGKPTWAGCGRHIDQALAGVPKGRRCSCREEPSKKPREAASPPAKKWLFGLFG